jgi:predicted GIY-YIG superfamily endonuclease
LLTKFPNLAKEAYGWNPELEIAGSNRKLDWKCSKGHIYKASGNSRVHNKSGCPICAGLKVLPGFNDLATTHPEISRQAEGWDTTKVIAGSAKKFTWRCDNGHIYISGLNKRTARGQGCPSCSDYGFNPSKESFLYLIHHTQWEMFQIGITNDIARRANEHASNGWELLEFRGPMDGYLAQQWETAILRMLKAKDADLSNSKIAGKFDGYSEAWSKSTFAVKSIKELMQLTESFEEN